MDNGAQCLIAFFMGAGSGAFVAWKILKYKYEQLVQKEIEEAKKYYSEKQKKNHYESEKHIEEPSEITTNADVKEYVSTLENQGYAYGKNVEIKEVPHMNKPYVIPPEIFGEEDSYDTVSLTYYADGVLTDDMDDPIENVDDIVGEDSLNHFGEYEEDSVFVRNDGLKCDYEILFDSRNYYGRCKKD